MKRYRIIIDWEKKFQKSEKEEKKLDQRRTEINKIIIEDDKLMVT